MASNTLQSGVCRYGCGRAGVHYRATLCHACYERDRRQAGGKLSDEHKFFARVFGENESGCWIWGGARSGEYGLFVIRGEKILAHRWAYEFARAEIPNGLVIDHLCRNTRCVNPWHLEPVTIAENTRRGESPMIVASRDNVCPRGHSLEDAIVLLSGPQKGRRNCRSCTGERRAKQAADPEFRARHAARERARKARKAASDTPEVS